MTTHAPRFRSPLGAAVLAVSVLAGAAGAGGCGAGSDPAPEKAAARNGASQAPPPSPRPAPSQAEVTEKLRRLEKTREARVGAYAIDTGTGRFVSYRGDERFPYASSFKAMACAAVLRKARRSEPGLMDRVIRLQKSDLSGFSPDTEKHVGAGMTVAELCRAAITKSDNTAANLLLKQIGGTTGLTAFFRSLGDTVSRSDRLEPGLNEWRPGEPRDTTAPRPWAGDLRALTVGDALAPADRERLVGWLKATVTGDKRIRAGLPSDWTVGDKTGTAGVHGNANDIAIAWPPSGAPLVIAILVTKRDPAADPDDLAVSGTASVLARALRPS